MDVTVRSLSGVSATVRCEPGDTVGQLRRRATAAAAAGLDLSCCQLFLSGTRLKDSQALASLPQLASPGAFLAAVPSAKKSGAAASSSSSPAVTQVGTPSKRLRTF